MCGCFFAACDNNIDDIFSDDQTLRLILMDALEEPYANPKDEYVYKLMAQCGAGLDRVVISNVSHELENNDKLPTIVLANDVTVNEEGYLSASVKTAIIEYPITVPSLPGETISLDFTVTAKNGQSQTITSSMLIANFKEKNTSGRAYFYHTFKAKGYAFYSTELDAAYGMTPTLATYYKKNIEHIDFYGVSDGATNYYFMSPDEPEIVDNLEALKDMNYVPSEMRKTLMVKLEGVDYKKAKDKEIMAIDFTNTVGKIQVKKGDVIGFKTADGRKGLLNITGASGKYIDFKCKVQTVPQ